MGICRNSPKGEGQNDFGFLEGDKKIKVLYEWINEYIWELLSEKNTVVNE